ncbi:MAG TPA: 2-hydroxymuconate tautomerase [Rhodocyclaceae bacterium]|jgi:4-oxalocrotonate tautomerase
MPICQIHLMEGRSPEQKRALIANVTEAICLSVGAKPDAVRIIITEMPKEHFGIAGTSAAELGR